MEKDILQFKEYLDYYIYNRNRNLIVHPLSTVSLNELSKKEFIDYKSDFNEKMKIFEYKYNKKILSLGLGD